ncbi:2-oxo-hept-4-ene-1,7-dioate hydratase [Roseibium sp.]|uniref:2-oxo-hept-4-ene-1,7-dioate hydratase n=1 Tax=Roseibium sp. TaxID=1936156 RepID=UPI003A980008
MSLSQAEISAAAEALHQAEAAGAQIGLLSVRHPDMTMDDAYAVQKALTKRKISEGRKIIGWKIGLTSKAMQQALSIDIPDSGMLFDDMLFENGATIPAGRFIQPRIEAEIAFVMRHDLPVEALTRQTVLDATDYVVPSLEILDTRIMRKDPKTGTSRTIVDTIADNAANAGLVLGKDRIDPRSTDLRWIGAIVTKNGEVEETGLGGGVLNDPVESVLWLARRMASYGQRIEAGQIILSGSFIRPVECPAGADITADFGAHGSVTCKF